MSGTTNAGTNEFNIGSDTTLTVVSSGTVVAATILISFDAKQITADLDSTALNGNNAYRYVEKGWDLSLEFDRQDSTLDTYFALKEAARYQGAQPPVVQITENTTNTDGSISIFSYTGVTLKFDTIGMRKGDAKIEPKVSGKASTRAQKQ